jgi:hypothetical protein
MGRWKCCVDGPGSPSMLTRRLPPRSSLLQKAYCSGNTVQRVQVFSDTVCPWCWVGKHTLEKLVGELNNPPKIELLWTPYLLDPKAGKDGGITVLDYYTKKYGPEAAALQHGPDNPLIKAGAALGLHFNDQRRIVPTITSHRCVRDILPPMFCCSLG